MTEVLEGFPCAVTSLFAIISDDAAMSRNRSSGFDDPRALEHAHFIFKVTDGQYNDFCFHLLDSRVAVELTVL